MLVKSAPDIEEPIQRVEDLGKGIIIPKWIFEQWLEFWGWTWHGIARNEFPGGFADLKQFQLACLCMDKALWVEAFLREPTDPDHQDPYSLWDYQKEALRYPWHKIYYCGAEVGKTRDIVADEMYSGCTVQGGTSMVGAPQQTHLDEIIDAMTDQMLWNPALGNLLIKHKKHPHHAFYLATEQKRHFRPSGHDGEAFRGLHVGNSAKIDEAAKMDNPREWSEFWRGILPNCAVSIYSVPDGRRDTEFYKLGQRAQKSEASLAPPSTEKNIFRRIAALSKLVGTEIGFKFFRFDKTMMPPPFWTPARQKFYEEQYGGVDSSGYLQNVLGLDGAPAYSVWPWHQLRHCVKEIPEYRALKILVDTARDEVIVKGYRCEFVSGDEGPVMLTVPLLDMAFPVATFFAYDQHEETEFKRLIRSFFSNVPGRKRGGADFGHSPDPTEILVKVIIGQRERIIARLQLKVVTYDQQCQAIDALDDLCGPTLTTWGTDIGNAGSAVMHFLQGEPRYAHKNYKDRLTGVMFESTTDNVGMDGTPIINAKTEKAERITKKELATDLMSMKIQKQLLEIPPDSEITTPMTSHTVSNSGKHRIYSKKDDHTIDGLRADEIAAVSALETDTDEFSCGSTIR